MPIKLIVVIYLLINRPVIGYVRSIVAVPAYAMTFILSDLNHKRLVMTKIVATHPSLITIKRNGSCNTIRKKHLIDYEVGVNTNNEMFIRMISYNGTGKYSKDWFLIADLVDLFILANGAPVTSFEPFDGYSKPLPPTSNLNISGYLKAVLTDTIK
ncbi:hypothetical protein [Aeromonas sobria]|uniref:hypothetical protein n=1 Tax=Aeromonas sobria TaxID=646 RepID=UPI0011196EC3|nr:hypothetical protein [Aeromonas sobria]